MIGRTPFDTTYEGTPRINRRRRLPQGTWPGKQHSGMPREIDPNGHQMSMVTHFDAITETENSV